MLLGVNSDPTVEIARHSMRQQRVTWESWWDGEELPGPIASEWEVSPWPAIYLIDPQGIIRYKDVGRVFDGSELETAIETLLAEFEDQDHG